MFSHMYIWLAVYFLLWWFFLYFWKKEYRKEMFVVGILGLFSGPLVQITHLKDWWQPLFLYNNFPLKIEDLIFGFSIAGVGAVIYQEIRGLKEKKIKKLTPSIFTNFIFILTPFALFFSLFYFFGVHSFWTSVISLTMMALFVVKKRIDLFHSMILSGVFLTIIAFVFYTIALSINPAWFEQEWFLDRLSGIFVFSIPIEELVWYFFAGLTLSAIWEFVNGLKFTQKETS